MTVIGRWLSRVARIASQIGGLACLAMAFLMSLDVLTRSLGTRMIGAFELSAALMTLVVFLPLMLIQREGGHVFVSIGTGWLPDRAKAILDALVSLASAVLMGAFVYWTTTAAWRATLADEHFVSRARIASWPFRWVVAMGFALYVIQLLATAVDHVNAARAPRPPPEHDIGADERFM